MTVGNGARSDLEVLLKRVAPVSSRCLDRLKTGPTPLPLGAGNAKGFFKGGKTFADFGNGVVA